MRGDVYRLRRPRQTVGREQSGHRFAIVVQSSAIPLSTALVVPTSASAAEADFRPEVMVDNQLTRALVEQMVAIDPQRLGERVGALTFIELRSINQALRDLLDL